MSIELERQRANAQNASLLVEQKKNYVDNANKYMIRLYDEKKTLADAEKKKNADAEKKKLVDAERKSIIEENFIISEANHASRLNAFRYTIEDEQTKMDYLQRKQMHQMQQMQQMQQMPQNPQVPSIQQQNPIYTTQDGMIILSTLANGEWIVLKTFDKSDKKQKTKKAQRWIKLTPQFGSVFMSQYGLYVLETPTTSGVSEFAYLYLCN